MSSNYLRFVLLQDRCGYEYTSPLQRMLIDMKVSDDLTKEFDQHLENKNEKLNVVFSVNILQVMSLFYRIRRCLTY